MTPITNEDELRAAISSLPPEGGVVEFSGTISLTSTIILGNGSDTQRSDYNNITLRGIGSSGTSELDMGIGRSSSPSKLIWNGPSGETMIQFSGPISGITLENLFLDCNHLASTAIDAVRSFNTNVSNIIISNWTNGYAVILRANTLFNGQGLGGGGAPHHCLFSMLYLSNPGPNGSGIQIAPIKGNVNQVTFLRCTVYYSPESIGLDLGLTDHISFISCFFAVSEGFGGTSIQVTPPSGAPSFNSWPQNVTLYDTPFSGGIKLNGDWKRSSPALLLYPLYTADGQKIPPIPSETDHDLLPVGLVSGYTDQGERLGILPKGERRLIFSNNQSSNSISNITTTVNEHTYFDNIGEVYADLLHPGTIIQLSASGRITKPTSITQTIEVLFYLGLPYLSAARMEITNTLSGYLWGASCDVVVVSRLANPDKLILRRNGGSLSAAFTSPVSAWAAGSPSITLTSKVLSARVSVKWGSIEPSGCLITLDSFRCELIQG